MAPQKKKRKYILNRFYTFFVVDNIILSFCNSNPRHDRDVHFWLPLCWKCHPGAPVILGGAFTSNDQRYRCQ